MRFARLRRAPGRGFRVFTGGAATFVHPFIFLFLRLSLPPSRSFYLSLSRAQNLRGSVDRLLKRPVVSVRRVRA